MELTKKDRLLLINQYQILSTLNPGESAHYLELIEILEDGYAIFYSLIDAGISDDMPESEGRFVLDVLNMYRAIEDFKRKNSREICSEEYYRFFRGFDGNEETKYMAFARFLVETQKKFTEQKTYLKENDNLNSHMPTIHKYRAMLSKWRKFGNTFSLGEVQVIEIVKA
ncbi:MAG TPA: YfbU family protein [Verrucomicrobiales bacterium]|nr:YfbU family protein [Verrucomicrobiales bacterium]